MPCFISTILQAFAAPRPSGAAPAWNCSGFSLRAPSSLLFTVTLAVAVLFVVRCAWLKRCLIQVRAVFQSRFRQPLQFVSKLQCSGFTQLTSLVASAVRPRRRGCKLRASLNHSKSLCDCMILLVWAVSRFSRFSRARRHGFITHIHYISCTQAVSARPTCACIHVDYSVIVTM